MLINFSYLFKKYNVHATGVLHIGAHFGQEAEAYWNEGIRNILFIEAHRPTYKRLCQNMLKFPGVIAVNACISDKDGEIVPFSIASNEGQSSSMLEFETHSQEHPTVVFTEKTRLQTARIDTIFKDRKFDPSLYNFVNIDIQGAELMALKGMDLSNIDYAYIEVNEKHLYKNCPLVGEIDAYLSERGLHRVETKMTSHGWGDAFYIRTKKEHKNIVNVPKQFQPDHPFKYPGDNDIDFEKWYLLNFTRHEGRVYLPVMWTAYYCKQRGNISSLQTWLNNLDKSVKYYTIVQYDDGILNDVSHLDLYVFSMSGKGDYYLPLICQPHKEPPAPVRDIFCSFVGRKTHPIREQILKIKEPGWLITDKVEKLPKFCNILSRSIFTLCPRGYGPTSFRIAEAMQYGSIPVYISDTFIEPHGIKFELYGVKIHEAEIRRLPAILDSIADVERSVLRMNVSVFYYQYFTYEANRQIIYDTLSTIS